MAANLVQTTPQGDQIETLTHGERWFVDAFSVMQLPGGCMNRQCDMSQAARLVSRLKQHGIAATYTHVLLRAVALALSRCPESHQIVCGYRRIRPGRVDIGLSVAGQTSYAPVLVISDATNKTLPALVQLLKEAVPQTREKEQRDLDGMKRNGWLIPIGFLRRAILRLLGQMFWFRHKLVGTFQVTCVRQVDSVTPLTFYSSAALGAGEVRDRVIAVQGRPEVRPTMILTMSFDHGSLDGRRTSDLLETIASILESDELLREVEQQLGPLPVVDQPVLPSHTATSPTLSDAAVLAASEPTALTASACAGE